MTADAAASERFGITERLAVNARAAGPRLGRGVQGVIRAAKAGAWSRDDQGAVVVATDDGPVVMLEPEYELTTVVGEQAGGGEVAASVLPGGGFVVLDLALDDALRAEGYARDVVRDVQDARKAAGLEVSDRIALELDVPAAHVADVEAHRGLVMSETLATTLTVTGTDGAERVVRVAKEDA
jgi:isoleucyl-tRNA synthetase